MSNPTGQRLEISSSVKGFKQIESGQKLSFYDDKQLAEAFVIDSPSFVLEPRQAVRVYFGVDATKLPSGDVLAALLFTTSEPKKGAKGTVVAQSVSVGTLITLQSEEVEHKAKVQSVEVPFLQLGQRLSGSYSIKNPAESGTANAFYPAVTIKTDPSGLLLTKTDQLLSAGITRTSSFSSAQNMVGFYKVIVSTEGSSKQVWVFAILGWGWAIAISIVSLLAAVIVMAFKLRVHHKKHQ